MLDFIEERESVWSWLAAQTRPVVLYGMGDGALKMIAACERHQIPVAGIFASDEFVRGQAFAGYPVERLADIEARWPDPILLLCFGIDYDSMLQRLAEIESRHTLLAPDLPVFGEDLFTWEYLEAHSQEFEAAYALLADEESRRIYRAMLHFKISGKLCYLWETMGSREEDFQQLLHLPQGANYLDLGAYDGDTVAEFIAHCPNYGQIVALEPSPPNYRKLCRRVGENQWPRVECIPMGSGSKVEPLSLNSRGGRSASFCKGGQLSVQVTTVDRLGEECTFQYIKMDVEGMEAETLRGATEVCRRDAPLLSIAAYHRSEDLYALPLLVHQINPEYNLYLRRHKYIPAWEILLYAMVK